MKKSVFLAESNKDLKQYVFHSDRGLGTWCFRFVQVAGSFTSEIQVSAKMSPANTPTRMFISLFTLQKQEHPGFLGDGNNFWIKTAGGWGTVGHRRVSASLGSDPKGLEDLGRSLWPRAGQFPLP